MTASKYWGEERHQDAIYSVLLKKVRYVPPSGHEGNQKRPLNPELHDAAAELANGADHLQWETIRERVIKAGTVQRLVESLIDAEGQMDSRQFNVFFATYRAFSSAEEVLVLITNWYDCLAPDPPVSRPPGGIHDLASGEHLLEMRNAIRSILVCWLEMYPEDFYRPTIDNPESNGTTPFLPLADRLIDFAKAYGLHDLKHKARKVRERLRRVAQNGGLSAQIPSIGRYSFAITGYDPNEPCTMSNGVSVDDGLMDEDERYARVLATAQERAQMFDTGPENVPQIAEQLTFWDALFFTELKPYQCQGAIWGRRHKTGPNPVYSVRATIDQFNALSERVMTSILLPECRQDFRARIIEKWIDVAKELRVLKNFSSLKAIISTLQSEPVFRLKAVWTSISKRAMAQLKELSAIFELDDESNNGVQKARHILESEGVAAKSATLGPPGGPFRRTKSDLNLVAETQGAIPFLGTFLTELEKTDQALPDSTPEGLVNFEKRRKEFEILAEIRLFQSAARAYGIQMDQAFCVWFHFLPALNEKECFTRSIELEPLASAIASANSSLTPDPRRKVRDGLQHMAKMNTLGKLFSGLGNSASSSKDSSFSSPATNGSFSLCATSIGALAPHLQLLGDSDSSPGSIPGRPNGAEFADGKPPKGTRSRSQGAKKEHRLLLKQRAAGGGLARTKCSPSPTRKINPAPVEERSSNGSTTAAAAAPSIPYGNTLGSEFSPTMLRGVPSHRMHRSRPSMADSRCDLELGDDSNVDDSCESTAFSRSRRTVNAANASCSSCSEPAAPVPFSAAMGCCSSSASSSFASTAPQPPPRQQKGASFGGGMDFAFAQHQQNGQKAGQLPSGRRATAHEGGVGGLRRINAQQQQSSQKSISSTSSRSSMGTCSIANSGSLQPTSKPFGGGSPSSVSMSNGPRAEHNFHLIRVGLDDSLQAAATINYKCIKVINGDRMPQLIERALEKHMLEPSECPNYCLVQLLPDGNEFRFPDHCNPFYAVAPDPTSSMLNCVLRKRSNCTPLTAAQKSANESAALARKANKQKRNNLLRWNSGYL